MCSTTGKLGSGYAGLGKDNDEKIQINADNVNRIEDVNEDDVGTSRIIFNDGTSIHVTESKKELADIINA